MLRSNDERVTMIVTDRSISMMTQDYPPNRLQASLTAASEFIKARAQAAPLSQVGFMTFCKTPTVLFPPLNAVDASTAFEQVRGSIGPSEYTYFFEALLLAQQYMPVNGEIVFLSDGEDLGDREGAQAIAQRLRSAGVKIHCRGIGHRDAVDHEHLRRISSRACYEFVGDARSLVMD